jgi:hypothetical protein
MEVESSSKARSNAICEISTGRQREDRGMGSGTESATRQRFLAA